VNLNGKKKNMQKKWQRFERLGSSLLRRAVLFMNCRIYVGVDPRRVSSPAVILFPILSCHLFCGLTGIVTFKTMHRKRRKGDPAGTLLRHFMSIQEKDLSRVLREVVPPESYLDSRKKLGEMNEAVLRLKEDGFLESIFSEAEKNENLQDLAKEMNAFILEEERLLEQKADHFSTESLEIINSRLILLKDVSWGLEKDILGNLTKIEELSEARRISGEGFRIYAQVNYLLNCLDRIEVRGRDSAGIQINVTVGKGRDYEKILQSLRRKNLLEPFVKRSGAGDLLSGSIHASCPGGADGPILLTFTYKTASVIGELGRNVRELRKMIRDDVVFHECVQGGASSLTSMAHTRWASVGSITEENCHPVNNFTLPDGPAATPPVPPGGLCGLPISSEAAELLMVPRAMKKYPRYGEGDWSVSVVLNGDVDNYPALRNDLEAGGRVLIAPELTTDTKIIPLTIEKHLLAGRDLQEAFRLAVSDFEGSHAVAMTSDLEPGRVFLAQKGGGQSIYIGLCEDKYIFSSELYGLVEGTPRFIKMDGESDAGGQIFILQENPQGGLSGIQAFYYDGTPIPLTESDVKQAEITTRDIDRGTHPHFFLKEIWESSLSVRKTLRGKYRIAPDGQVVFNLGKDILPPRLRKGLTKKIRHIVIIGHGTAAVAGAAVADGFARCLKGKHFTVEAKKASELSGFALADDLSDTLVVAITQSGTTTDTNRAVAMAAERGATVIAIVNRRQSDITHKAHGVFYTSDGRDIEMSVASTKAFYSQIVAGHVLALCVSQMLGLGDDVIGSELKALEQAPDLMRRVLSKAPEIKASAWNITREKRYWAVVGSGPNKVAADEIRIKLSELCYKTISSDIVEDKKHIDLSAEPLIIVCAAGSPEAVLGDIIKDVSIFKAHKAGVVVFADEGERRFDAVADSVIALPAGPLPLPVILNTMAGHLWGYYAACSIDEGSSFFQEFRNVLNLEMVRQDRKAYTLYDRLADKNLHLILDSFYGRFNDLRNRGAFSPTNVKTISDISLLVKYASGKLPLEDYWSEFNGDNTANPIELLNVAIGHAVDELSRPIDAIRHQAKTVTVGTSRKEEVFRGPLFDILKSLRFSERNLKGQNILALGRIQRALSGVKGYTLYDINNLDEEGVPLDTSTIAIRQREGISLEMKSRAEGSKRLMGTKRTIVRTGNIFAGYGRSDGAAITIIPLLGSKPGVRSLLLAHVEFNEALPAKDKAAVLGDRYTDVRNMIHEYNLPWDDSYLDRLSVGTLLGESVEFIATKIKKSLEEK
jgi:glucosamine--fructose-6-phosphate aminotransferase (isomerizing)